MWPKYCACTLESVHFHYNGLQSKYTDFKQQTMENGNKAQREVNGQECTVQILTTQALTKNAR